MGSDELNRLIIENVNKNVLAHKASKTMNRSKYTNFYGILLRYKGLYWILVRFKYKNLYYRINYPYL